MSACVRACVLECVRACVCLCVCVHACLGRFLCFSVSVSVPLPSVLSVRPSAYLFFCLYVRPSACLSVTLPKEEQISLCHCLAPQSWLRSHNHLWNIQCGLELGQNCQQTHPNKSSQVVYFRNPRTSMKEHLVRHGSKHKIQVHTTKRNKQQQKQKQNRTHFQNKKQPETRERSLTKTKARGKNENRWVQQTHTLTYTDTRLHIHPPTDFLWTLSKMVTTERCEPVLNCANVSSRT